MANLPKGNTCSFDCGYYDMEANDYYYQWCHHPEAKEGEDSGYVMRCPLSDKPTGEEATPRLQFLEQKDS